MVEQIGNSSNFKVLLPTLNARPDVVDAVVSLMLFIHPQLLSTDETNDSGTLAYVPNFQRCGCHPGRCREQSRTSRIGDRIYLCFRLANRVSRSWSEKTYRSCDHSRWSCRSFFCRMGTFGWLVAQPALPEGVWQRAASLLLRSVGVSAHPRLLSCVLPPCGASRHGSLRKSGLHGMGCRRLGTSECYTSRS